MISKILIITNKSDVTSDFIVKKLRERKIDYYRLNTEDLYSTVSFTFNFDTDYYYLYDANKHSKYNLWDFTAVYFRRPLLPTFMDSSLSDGDRDFLEREAYYTLKGLYKILDNKFWISKPNDIQNAENKFYQLQLAKKLGFLIPPSLATNIPSDFRKFTNGRKCIIKAVHSSRIQGKSSQKIAFTSELTESPTDEEIRCSTAYLQKEICKKYDVRVTVVGNKVFAAAINSQMLPDTKVDWRRGEHILKHNRITLPPDIESKCLKLLTELNLQYGAIDFVVDKADNYYFLEINPNGQWAWIEKQTGYDISGTIVDTLCNVYYI